MTPDRSVPLVEVYQKLFEAITADTPDLLRQAHQLRYQVYCVENAFEDPSRGRDGLEFDEFDSHSVQAILFHRLSSRTVGTIRLVLHEPGARCGTLPIHRVCKDARLCDPEFLPLETTAELSRFAISKAFRQRCDDAQYGRAYEPEELIADPRRVIPHITLGLMAVALQMGNLHGVENVCAVMELPLLRLLARFGLYFKLIGEPVEYHGWRQPCYANVEELIAGVEAERPDVWEVITDCGRLLKPRKRFIAPHYATA
jgi:N-acyl amino acid synthase of PEP-CTERM/exosortase system